MKNIAERLNMGFTESMINLLTRGVADPDLTLQIGANCNVEKKNFNSDFFDNTISLKRYYKQSFHRKFAECLNTNYAEAIANILNRGSDLG